MNLYERVGNIHIHTTYSDGTGTFEEIAQAANEVGLDYLIITDHNVYAGQHAGWYRHTLVLVGEEVHPNNINHYLVINAQDEMAPYAQNAQALINAVRARGGLGFLAHPFEHSGAYAREPEINWLAWDVHGYTGLELWNYMSEFKSYISDPLHALLYALFPKLAIRGPYPETLAKWDELLGQRPTFAIGGTDAHAITYRMGPLKRQVFSYRHLFRTVNTHLLVSEPWNGNFDHDAQLIYEALAKGRAFIGYEALGETRGFSFTAEQGEELYTLGDTFLARGPFTLHVRLPKKGHIRLILNGFCIAKAKSNELYYQAKAPGAYRVEVYRPFAGKLRGWIFANPIFVHTRRRGKGN